MGMLTEFKEFAMRGNVIDLAVGVVIGAAFGKIVTALVEKIIMPPLGYLIGRVDFSSLAWTLSPAHLGPDGKEIPAVVVGYGDFINTIIQFVIVAFAIFIVVKAINRLSRKQEAAPAAPAESGAAARDPRQPEEIRRQNGSAGRWPAMSEHAEAGQRPALPRLRESPARRGFRFAGHGGKQRSRQP